MPLSRLGSWLRQGHRGRWCGTLPCLFLFLFPVVPVEVPCKLQSHEGERELWLWSGNRRGQPHTVPLTSGSMSSARGADEFWGDKQSLRKNRLKG